MRRIFLLVALLSSFALQPVLAEGGVGILQSAEQAGLTVECPAGVAGCKVATEESEAYSITGTQNFILNLVGGLLNFAAIAAVVMLIIVALRFIVAHGNQDAIAVAKKQITWTLIGLLVIILSLLLVKNITQKVYQIAAVDETATPVTENAGEDEGITEEDIVDPPAPCSIMPPPSVPAACFAGEITGTQYSTGSSSCKAPEIVLKSICDKLGVSPCKVIGIQSAVSAYYYVSGHPETPLSANCSKIDGLYGQCTQTAIQNYFDKNGCGSSTPVALVGDNQPVAEEEQPIEDPVAEEEPVVEETPKIQCHIYTKQDPTGAATNVVFVTDASQCECLDGYKVTGSDDRGVFCEADSGWF